MTKNMTRKSLALGAAAALVVTGFSAMPANSAGLADTSFVSLAPTTGTEYGMQAAADVPFRMTANEATTVSTGNLKFLVEDTAGAILPSVNTTGALQDTLANADLLFSDNTNEYLVFTTSGIADGAYAMWTTLPIIMNDGGAAPQTALAARTLIPVTVDADQVTFKSAVDLAAGIDTAAGGNVVANFFLNDNTTVIDVDTIAAGTSEVGTFVDAAETFVLTTVGVPDGEYIVTAQTVLKLDDADAANLVVAMAAGSTQKVTVTSNAAVFTSQNAFDASTDETDASTVLTFTSTTTGVIRSSVDNSYVVDSGVTSATTSEVLELLNDGTTTRSVNVTAFMDANVNGAIDSTEYASPARTVTWTKPSEIVATTTMVPIVGDTVLSAVITTTPVLNGQQLLASDTDFINAKFTRTLSTSTVYGDDDDTSNGTATTTSIWNDTAKTFTVAVTLDADAADEASDATGTTAADSWAGLAAPIAEANTVLSLSTTGLVTVTTAGGNHGLANGDLITYAVHADESALALAAETVKTPVTVTGAQTFTYQVSETTGFPTSTLTDPL